MPTLDRPDDEMDKQPAAAMSAASAANLMALPLASASAAQALAFGMASQAFGLWYGAALAVMRGAPAAREIEQAASGGIEFLAYGSEPEGRLEGDEAKTEPVAKPPRAPKPARAPKAAKPAAEAPPVRTLAKTPPLAPAPVETALLPEDFRRPRRIDRPASPDDLKLVAGIGPKLEKVLNGLGVWTWAQIAAWGPEEIAWVDDFMAFNGRIARDGWIDQARALAAGGRDEYVRTFGREPR